MTAQTLRVVVGTRPGKLTDALVADAPAGVEMIPLAVPPRRDDRAEVLCVGGPIAAPVHQVLASLPRLRWIHSVAAGVDRFLVPELVERDDIVMTNSSGAHALPMAEFVVGCIFAAAKQLPTYVRNHDRRLWPTWDGRPTHRAVLRSTVLILGPGRIGREVARMARGVGLRVMAVRRRPEPLADVDEIGKLEDLPRLAARADHLVVTAALTPETRGAVSREVIAALPRDAWVINVGRGPIIDEEALYEAARDARVGGAVLDALWQEPLPPESRWWDLPNVLITGHASAGSGWILTEQLAHFRENLRRYRSGESLLNVVDKRAGY